VLVWTTADDALVPAAHSERFAEACGPGLLDYLALRWEL
jgi:hypothetical protein